MVCELRNISNPVRLKMQKNFIDPYFQGKTFIVEKHKNRISVCLIFHFQLQTLVVRKGPPTYCRFLFSPGPWLALAYSRVFIPALVPLLTPDGGISGIITKFADIILSQSFTKVFNLHYFSQRHHTIISSPSGRSFNGQKNFAETSRQQWISPIHQKSYLYLRTLCSTDIPAAVTAM
jgi:hypothetical protein